MYSQTEESVRDERWKFVQQRWQQLHELQKGYAERAVRYLLLTNSGGAIATLSFIGAAGGDANLEFVKYALIAFVTGILFVGISYAKALHTVSGLFDQYKTAAFEYLGDSVSWEKLYNDDVIGSKSSLTDYVIPYIAFACFGLGCVLGGCYLLSGGT